MADVTGDGRPDFVDAITECSGAKWIVWRNTGERFAAERWPAPNVPQSNTSDSCAIRITQNLTTTVVTWQEMVDFTGDAIPDVAYWTGPDMWICRGTGHGFAPCSIWGALPPGVTAGVFRRESTAIANVSATDVDLIDFNADGFVDRVSTSVASSPPRLRVVLNDHGKRWGALTEYAIPACGYAGFVACLRLTERIVSSNSNRRILADIRDINADGVPDFLRTDMQSGAVQAAWGTGADFGLLRSLPGSPKALGLGHESSGGDYRALLDLADLNGDGFLDILEQTSTSPPVFSVRYGYGVGWDTLSHLYAASPNPPAASYAAPTLASQVVANGEAVETRSALVDLNGDGILDLVTSPLSSQVGSGSVLLRSLTYRAPRLLVRTESLSGNIVTTIDYAPLPGVLPFAIHVPRTQSVRRTPLYSGEPLAQTEETIEYKYADAVYDPIDREFRGFSTVVATPILEGAVVTTNYRTGKYSAGLIETETVANLHAGGRPRTIVNDYTESTVSIGSVFVQLDRRRVFDGALGQWRIEETEFGDYTYGRPQVVVAKGSLSTPTDDVTTQSSFVVRRDSDHLIVVPSTVSRSRFGTTVARTQNYYDNRTVLGATPTKGNLVRTRHQRAPFLWVDNHAYYDDEGGNGVGVMTSYVDPEGTQTHYDYDSTYHMFPVRETNPIGTTHRSFHALSQTIADICGPQYLGTSWRCGRTEVDILGRPVGTHLPVIKDGAFQMVRTDIIEYDDFTYPLRVEWTARPGVRDVGHFVRYLDGLGGVAQVRTEESRNVFRVLDMGNDPGGRNVWRSQPRRESGSGYSSLGDPGREGYHNTYDYVRGAVETSTFPRDAGDPRPPARTSKVHFGTHVVAIDEVGRQATSLIDSFGRVYEFERDGGALGVAHTVYVYDANGAVESITDPNGLTTRYERNMLGWTTAAVMPDSTRYEYLHNQRGQVRTRLDPRGMIVQTDYDVAGRVEREFSTVTLPNVRSIDETAIYHDASSDTAQIGWVRERAADGVSQQMTYDAGGRLSNLTSRYQGWFGTVSASWTTDGLLASVSYGDWTVRYQYYLDGTPRSVLDAQTGEVLGEQLLADNGRPSVVTSDFGLEESFDYDARDRLTRIVSSNTNANPLPFVDDTYSWDDASQLAIIRRGGLRPGAVPRPTADIFAITHDGLGHLERVLKNGGGYAHYAHDRGGRLLTFNELGDAYTYSYQFDLMQERVSSAMTHWYEYDASGNVINTALVGLPGTGYYGELGWDASGRVSDVRIERPYGDVQTTAYHYLGGQISLVAGAGVWPGMDETLHIGEWMRINLGSEDPTYRVFLGSRMLLERRFEGISFAHRSLGGSVAAVTSEYGSVLTQEEFLPYGQTETQSGGALHEEGFHGLRRDELVVAGPRAYDASSGRWMARDPLMLDSDAYSSMLDLDGYSYAYGRPFGFRDPSGFAPEILETLEWYADTAWDYSPWVQVTYKSNYYVGSAIKDFLFDDGAAVNVVRTFVLQTALNARAAGDFVAPLAGPILMYAGDRVASAMGAESWVQQRGDGVFLAGLAPPGFRGWAINLSMIADDIRMAASHRVAADRRVIAVGMDANGALYVAGASGKLDKGMAAFARRLGIKIVDEIVDNPRALRGLHAEEKLLYAVPNIQVIGTSFRSPCGPAEHNCLAAVQAAGVEVRGAVKDTKQR